MSADVTKPEMCPVGLDSIGQRVDFVAVVASGDLASLDGAAGSLRFVDPVGFAIDDSDGFPIFEQCSFFFNPDADETECNLNHYYFAGTLGEPVLDQGTTWTKTDTAKFEASFFDPDGPLEGSAELSYTFDPQTAINAPNSVEIMSSVSIWANVLNGRAPLQYEWFERHGGEVWWTPVGSNSDTYERFMGSDGTWDFKVRVTDADGDTRETIHSIGVYQPDGGGGGGRCIICF
jgi:hypothetical protein